MKKVKFNIKQLNEVLNVAVDVQNGDVNGSLQKAKSETDKSIGSGTERNYVIPDSELNEEEGDEIKPKDKCYTKKQIEKSKINKLKENCIVFTKKELNESFKNE